MLNRPIYLWPPTIHRSTKYWAWLNALPPLKPFTRIPAKSASTVLREFAYTVSYVQGLAELLESVNLTEYLGAAKAFCVLNGAKDVAYLKLNLKGHRYPEKLAKWLNLPPIPAEMLVNAIQDLVNAPRTRRARWRKGGKGFFGRKANRGPKKDAAKDEV